MHTNLWLWIGRNPLIRLVRKPLPVSDTYHGARFTVLRDGRRLLTPLAMVLIVVETTDVLFAIDSIPAIFGITRDPFIVYTSNVYAILGLRFPARWCRSQVCLSEASPGSYPLLYRRQDAPGGSLSHPNGGLTHRHRLGSIGRDRSFFAHRPSTSSGGKVCSEN